VGQRLLRLVLLGLLVLAAGCGGDDGDGKTTTESRVPGPSDELVAYERTGGIAGVTERLDVRPDGAARISVVEAGKLKRDRFKLTPGELDGLRAAVDAAEGADLEIRYGSDPEPNDAFKTNVLVDGRVITVVSGGDPPPELDRLLNVCAGLIQQHRPR